MARGIDSRTIRQYHAEMGNRIFPFSSEFLLSFSLIKKKTRKILEKRENPVSPPRMVIKKIT